MLDLLNCFFFWLKFLDHYEKDGKTLFYNKKDVTQTKSIKHKIVSAKLEHFKLERVFLYIYVEINMLT